MGVPAAPPPAARVPHAGEPFGGLLRARGRFVSVSRLGHHVRSLRLGHAAARPRGSLIPQMLRPGPGGGASLWEDLLANHLMANQLASERDVGPGEEGGPGEGRVHSSHRKALLQKQALVLSIQEEVGRFKAKHALLLRQLRFRQIHGS